MANKKLKQLIATGAIVGVLVTSLTACSPASFVFDIAGTVFDDNQTSSYTQSYDETNDAYIDDNTLSGTGNATVGESNNYLLYAQNSGLSTTIGTDLFGYGESKNNDNADRRVQEGPFKAIDVNLSAANYNKFTGAIMSKKVVYKYSDLYGIDAAISEANKYTSKIETQKHQHTDLICSINKIPSKDVLRDKIQSNTSEYLRNNPHLFELDSSYMDLLVDILVETLEQNYDQLSTEDKTRIYCMLNDVKLVGVNSADFTTNDLKQMYNARVTDEGVVMIDPEIMKQLRGKNTVEKTVAHEVGHLFQRMCPDHVIAGYTQIGNSQFFDSFENTNKPNSLHFQWLYEATAEQMSMNLYNSRTPLVYANMVGYLRTLDLITLIRPGYEENSIAASQMSTNPNKIYELFGAKTADEKREVINLLYSICYIQNEREDFVASYESKYGDMPSDDTTIKIEMKNGVAQTMTKYFYKNLAERVANADVSLQDVFYLINAFESSLSRHLAYDDASRYNLQKETLEYYVQVQNQFFEYIAKDSGMTYEQIVDSFNSYALIVKDGKNIQRNYSFAWLDDEEKRYVGDLITSNIDDFTINIRNLEQMENTMSK